MWSMEDEKYFLLQCSSTMPVPRGGSEGSDEAPPQQEKVRFYTRSSQSHTPRMTTPSLIARAIVQNTRHVSLAYYYKVGWGF